PRRSADLGETNRAAREPGASFPELAEKYGVSHQAIQKRAKAEGWGDGTDVADTIRRKVAEKVAGVVAACNQKKKAEAIDAAAERGADVVRRHQAEWEDHRARFGSVPADFEDGKLAKISAEMLRIRQEGERRAWGLDADAAKADVVVKWEGVE
ncbi:MAG: hypothetical protein ACK4MJ_10585, partial [Hylemonella sp.]